MIWLLAQADAVTKEAVSNRLINLFENVLTNPISITCIFALAAMIGAAFFDYRYKHRKMEIEATLKQEMIRRGMSAEEIERVLAAKSDAKQKKADSSDKQTLPHPGSS